MLPRATSYYLWFVLSPSALDGLLAVFALLSAKQADGARVYQQGREQGHRNAYRALTMGAAAELEKWVLDHAGSLGFTYFEEDEGDGVWWEDATMEPTDHEGVV